MTFPYQDYWLKTYGKERMNKGDEALAVSRGGDLSRWGMAYEVIDLGDEQGRFIPTEDEADGC